MTIQKLITEFTVFDQDKPVDSLEIGSLIKAPDPIGWVNKQIIAFNDDGTRIEVELTGNFNADTVIKTIDSYDFDIKELNQIQKLYDLARVVNDNYVKLIPRDIDVPFLRVAVKPYEANDYLIVFFYSNGEGREPAKLFVHGIWKLDKESSLN